MAKRGFDYFDERAPAWARYNGERYVSSFSGTPKQKRERDRLVEKLLSGCKKRRRVRRRSRRGRR